MLPQAVLLGDELLRRAQRILDGLVLHDAAIAHNLAAFGTFGILVPTELVDHTPQEMIIDGGNIIQEVKSIS